MVDISQNIEKSAKEISAEHKLIESDAVLAGQEKNRERKKNIEERQRAGRIVEKYISNRPSGKSAGEPAASAVPENISVEEIERVLSGDLEEIYFQMPPDAQEKFKREGEAAAGKIKELLDKTTINVKKIARLIINWLKIIPGVNKFFIEQESKIKVDDILKLKKGEDV